MGPSWSGLGTSLGAFIGATTGISFAGSTAGLCGSLCGALGSSCRRSRTLSRFECSEQQAFCATVSHASSQVSNELTRRYSLSRCELLPQEFILQEHSSNKSCCVWHSG
jgi:hypothetical protein